MPGARKWGTRGGKRRRPLKSKGKRCLDCNKDISDRGRASKRCEPCATKHSLEWRKKYDFLPELVAKRAAYDKKPSNIRKSRERRNKKCIS